jgi:RecA/RadA recombinase
MKGIIIDVAGPIGSGKTQLCDAIQHLCQTKGYRTHILHEPSLKEKNRYARDVATQFDVTIFDGES